MTIISARNSGPISQAAARMPATAITAAAMPSNRVSPRGKPPGDTGADSRFGRCRPFDGGV